MKHQIEHLLTAAVTSLAGGVLPDAAASQRVEVERTRDRRHGDFASNIAMRLAKVTQRPPRELAQLIIDALPGSDLISEVEIAGPGFINFRLTPIAYQREICTVLDRGETYGRSNLGEGQRVLVEFVSANPTGPLHVGHGRLAAYGASVADLLAAAGYDVDREYYVNDKGRQMNILTASVWLRYLEACGESVAFPTNGYRGSYVRDIATRLLETRARELLRSWAEVSADLPPDAPEGDKEEHIDALIERTRGLLGKEAFQDILQMSLDNIVGDIREDLAEFGVHADRWFSERRLETEGAIERALQRLRERGLLYEKDGATWFRAERFGDEKDRVVVRENGQPTYFASDIAYHLHKRERGYHLLLDVLGADHHGYVARVRAGLEAMGEPGDSLEVRLVQFVALYRSGEKMQMSTRSGEFVALRDLRTEVGNDAARFFYVMRSNDQHLDFDLELAKSRSQDNPVYYIQYAHARISSVMRQLIERGLSWNPANGRANLHLLNAEHELVLLPEITRFPEVVELAAINRAPHTLAHYLRDLANHFHTYYNAQTFIVDEDNLRDARLTLIAAVKQVLYNGMRLLGVSAPESM